MRHTAPKTDLNPAHRLDPAMAANKQQVAKENFLAQFRDKKTRKLCNFTATQFAEVWSHYDTDGNGYIEGVELDMFLREFISSVVPHEIGPEVISENALKSMRRDFLDAFDENNDERIEIAELAQILPTDENFLLLFRRDNPLESSVEFMKVWKAFDKDHSGFIEADELKEFLAHLLKESRPEERLSEEKILEYTTSMLQLFDQNKDGKLQLSEMARLLPVRENYLCRPIFKSKQKFGPLGLPENAKKITSNDIDRVFNLYDRDKNGTIEDEELQGFLKDLLELAQEDYDDEDMEFFKRVILKEWDVNHDGKISKPELKMILLQQSRLATEDLESREGEKKGT